MTAAVQRVLNKSGEVFSKMKGAGLFNALSWHFTKERSLVVICFSLLHLSDTDENEHFFNLNSPLAFF